MRVVHGIVCALGIALLMPAAARAQDADRVVAGGGITAPGWKGEVDPASAKAGRTVADSKFVEEAGSLRLTIGPAAVYWNPADTAKGDFTVKASFSETGMGVRSGHPHPYGVFIGGNNLDTDKQTLMYCVAYGDGSFLIRQFNGATVNTLIRKTPNAAVHSTAKGGDVSNEVGWSVKGGRAECLINGTVVAGFDRADIVGPGKLDSIDGVYGIRVSHNLDVVVSGLGVK